MKNGARIEQQSPFIVALIIIVIIWSFFWKGVALWRAGELKQKKWFIAIFIYTLLYPILPNDLGIIEIAYLFMFAKRKMTMVEVKANLSHVKALITRSPKKS